MCRCEPARRARLPRRRRGHRDRRRRRQQRIALVGWSTLGITVLRELDQFLGDGSRVDVLVDPRIVDPADIVLPAYEHCEVLVHAVRPGPGVDDFIVSDELSSLMMAQLSERLELQDVFAELFDAAGCFVSLHPAVLYAPEGPTTFSSVVATAAERGASAVGAPPVLSYSLGWSRWSRSTGICWDVCGRT